MVSEEGKAEAVEFEVCGHRYRLRVFRRVNVGLENEGWAHEQEATAELLLASGFVPASSLAAAESELTEQIQANEALMAANGSLVAQRNAAQDQFLEALNERDAERAKRERLRRWAYQRRVESTANAGTWNAYQSIVIQLDAPTPNAELQAHATGDSNRGANSGTSGVRTGELSAPQTVPGVQPTGCAATSGGGTVVDQSATPAPPPEGTASPVAEGEARAAIAQLLAYPFDLRGEVGNLLYDRLVSAIRSQPTPTVERQAQAEGCPYPDCDCSGCVFCRVNHSPEAHENCHCWCERRAEGAKAAEGTYPNFREDVLLSMGVDWAWYRPEVLLDEVDEDPDGDEGYPPFGVDPGDSTELEKLRMSADDNLIWRDEKQQEAGDYEGAVEYSGELVTECLELRAKVAAIKAERAALVEFCKARLAQANDMDAQGVPSVGTYRDGRIVAFTAVLDALRAQPSPTSEAKDSSPPGQKAEQQHDRIDHDRGSGPKLRGICAGCKYETAELNDPPYCEPSCRNSTAPAAEVEPACTCPLVGPKAPSSGPGKDGRNAAFLIGHQPGCPWHAWCRELSEKRRDAHVAAGGQLDWAGDPISAAEVEQATGEAKEEMLRCSFCLGSWPVVDDGMVAMIRGPEACICQSCAWQSARMASEHTERHAEKVGAIPPPPTTGGHGPTEALRNELIAALLVAHQWSNMQGFKTAADELTKGGNK